jgi:hypothetical protein
VTAGSVFGIGVATCDNRILHKQRRVGSINIIIRWRSFSFSRRTARRLQVNKMPPHQKDPGGRVNAFNNEETGGGTVYLEKT